jgi:hypothetical protein
VSDQPILWLGVPAVDGARIGSLRLAVGEETSVVTLSTLDARGEPSWLVIASCPLAEVDARTRAWLAPLAALLRSAGPLCVVCNGTGLDENLDRKKLDDAVQKCLARADELRAADEAERAHLTEAARLLTLQLEWGIGVGKSLSEPAAEWLAVERKRKGGA